MQNKINIGLIGAGTVGSGAYKVLKENFAEIYRKTGKEIIVFALAEKDTKRAKEVADDKTLIFEDAFYSDSILVRKVGDIRKLYKHIFGLELCFF